MAKSKKASVKVTAASRERAAASELAKAKARRKSVAASAKPGKPRADKTGARAIQGHIQVRGKRQQARSDSR